MDAFCACVLEELGLQLGGSFDHTNSSLPSLMERGWGQLKELSFFSQVRCRLLSVSRCQGQDLLILYYEVGMRAKGLNWPWLRLDWGQEEGAVRLWSPAGFTVEFMSP